MHTTDQQGSLGEACPASSSWPAETGPRNPQASYYRARYYDSSSGRFIGEDPIRWASNVNFFAYVHNRTASATDPFGLDDRCPSWVPDWVCNLWKGPKGPIFKTCICTRTERTPKPYPKPGSGIKVCVYSCDCSSKPQIILLRRIQKLQGCKDIDFCPYKLVADVDTTGSSTTALPDPDFAPTLDPPQPGDIIPPQ